MNKALQREKTRLRVERYRSKEKALPKGSVTGEALHPILEALIDPVKRRKLEAISQELKARHVSEQVFYGCVNPIPFDVVGELLEVTS